MVRFGLYTAVLSILLSLVVTPLVDISWFMVARRCVSIAAGASLLWCILRYDHKPFSSYGLTAFAAGQRFLWGGLLFGLAGLTIMLAIGLWSGACTIDIHPDPVRFWRTVIGFAPAALLLSVLEELVFRGFIMQHLFSVSRLFAVVTSSGLYAIVHLKQRSLTQEGWMELAGLFLFGVLLAFAYIQTGHLWLGIGLHAVLAYGARVNKLLVELDGSMSWLVGTSRLVNGLSAWIALGAMGLFIWFWVRRLHKGEARYG